MLAIVILAALVCTIIGLVWFLIHNYWSDRRPDVALADNQVMLGSNMAWLAVKTDDTVRLGELLNLADAKAAGWQSGLGTVYNRRTESTSVFVSPPIGGWVLVCGLALPQPLGSGFIDKCTPLLKELGREFDDVQYFLSCPSLEYFAWARVIDGRLRRAYATGDEGVIWDTGRQTAAEHALGFKFFELRGLDEREGDAGGPILFAPTEAQVLELAGLWSINPATIDDQHQSQFQQTGVVGIAPRTWRAQRMVRAAA